VEQAEIRVRGDAAGRDLLGFLSSRLINESKMRLRRLVASGQIRINGNAVSTAARVSAGDCVSLPPDLDSGPPPAAPFALKVLHEDEDHIVIDKAPGHPVVAGGRGAGPCLYDALVGLLNHGAPAGGPYVRPHVVHRLDRQTSGVLLVAKNKRAGRELSLQFQHHLIEKTYAAVVEGVLPRAGVTVEIPIRRSASDSLRMTTDERSGKRALTRLVLKRAFGHFSLLNAEPRTGRQHQIRVHLAALGYPLVVDGAYGRRERLTGAEFNEIVQAPKVRADRLLLDRCPLHAQSIIYRHPSSGCQMAMSAPMPADMQEFLRLLGELDPGEASP